jgi:hypothetical protein
VVAAPTGQLIIEGPAVTGMVMIPFGLNVLAVETLLLAVL